MPEHASGARRKLARLVGREGGGREKGKRERRRKEEKKEGKKEGRKEGRREGREKARKEGRKENREEKMLEKKKFFSILFMELLQLFFCFPQYRVHSVHKFFKDFQRKHKPWEIIQWLLFY